MSILQLRVYKMTDAESCLLLDGNFYIQQGYKDNF